jgi:hypothetical protein
VVGHNGDKAGRFRRGSARVVGGAMRLVAPAVTGTKATQGGGARACEAAVAVVGPGRKMTGCGLHVSQAWRGVKAT